MILRLQVVVCVVVWLSVAKSSPGIPPVEMKGLPPLKPFREIFVKSMVFLRRKSAAHNQIF
jgi:hypothetical protein